MTGDLEVGTEWRNSDDFDGPVVLVAFAEEEKLGTFHRFTPIKDHTLYEALCIRAHRDFSPNQSLAEWWTVLRKADIRRQISVRRLAEYCLLLQDNKGRLPDAAREGLYVLGMLPSRSFFGHPSEKEYQRDFNANRALLARTETLSNTDRNKLSKSLDTIKEKDRQQHQTTIGLVLMYNRTGLDKDRKNLWAEDVLKMLEANKLAPGTKGKSKQQSTTTERAVAEAIFADDSEEIVQLGEKLREELEKPEDELSAKITIPLTNQDTQATVQVSTPLLALLRRAITPTCLGGIYRSPSSESLEQAMDDLDHAVFQPFELEGEKTADARIKLIVEHGYVEKALLTTWQTFVKARGILAADVAALAVSPLVAIASSKTALDAAQVYLDAYEQLLAIIKDQYEAVSVKSPKGIRALGALLITMDTVFIEIKTGLKAVLSPLHPLHLWKFVKLAEDLRRDKSTLNDNSRSILAERAENLPHFVTAVFVPEGLLSDQALVLPESGHIQSLPIYQQDDLHFSGNDGQLRIIRLFEKFLDLYRHARARLKIVLVDPPEAFSLLDQIANKVVRRELDVQSLHISVYRTLERPLVLGGNDQQLEAIAEVFSDDDRAFMLEVHPEKTTYGDIVRKLSKDPVHLMVVFDPSTTQVGQYFQSNRGIVHPLVLPKEFKYDAMEDELFITPAATGGVFDLFQSLQGRLNNALSGSQFGISSLLTGQFADTTDLLKHCTWLVIADRLLDSQPIKGGHMISYEQGARRDIVVLTESLTKFEREFDYQLRQTNFDPTPEAVRELIVSSGELIGEGLLGLISSSERDDNVF